jgi:hypothetical protein
VSIYSLAGPPPKKAGVAERVTAAFKKLFIKFKFFSSGEFLFQKMIFRQIFHFGNGI